MRINEFYGQTECNLVGPSQPDSPPHAIGRAVEGFDVAIVDDYGVPVPTGGSADIAVATPNGSQEQLLGKQPGYCREIPQRLAGDGRHGPDG